jgi:hypothetical protein
MGDLFEVDTKSAKACPKYMYSIKERERERSRRKER